jgi:hypothetical protein
VTHAIEASQRVMHNLRPAILEQGLVPALQWMAQRHEKRTGIECLLPHQRTRACVLPAGVPLVAYRTAQEALTNVSKHAQATRVSIDLMLAPDALAGGQRQRPRPVRPPTWPRRAASASAACTSARPPSAAGSTCRAAARGTTLILSIPMAAAGADPAPAMPVEEAATHDPSAWGKL